MTVVGSLFAGLGGTEISTATYLTPETDYGTGDITLATGGALLVNNGISVTVPNKVVFKGQNQNYTYVSSSDHSGSIALTSVGTPAEAASHHIRLGRASAAGLGWVKLALTDPLSEALDEIRLAGTLKLTLDGGTIKARSDAKVPFFRQMDAAGAVAMDVTTNGVAFDVASGASITPGFPLSVTAEWRHEAGAEIVAETYYPDNWSFEDYSGSPLAQPGWKDGDWVDDPHPNAYKEYSDVENNGGAHSVSGDVNWDTTNGTRFAMIRRGDSLKCTISLPTEGDWRILFELGCRPGSNSYSVNQEVFVTVDETEMIRIPGVAAADRHGFELQVSPKFHFTAGDHTLRLSVADSGVGSASMNFDAVRFERITVGAPVDEPIITAIAKAGSGTLVLADQTMPQTRLVAQEGALVLSNVKSDENSSIEVANGARVTFSGAQQNLVKNGNFEFQGEIDYTDMNPYGWTGTREDPAEKAYTAKGVGLQVNDGLLSGAVHTPYGRTTVFLRPLNSISQTVTVAEAGEYRLSLVTADRPYAQSYQIPLTVTVDDVERIVEPAAENTAFRGYRRLSASVTLAAGEHTVVIATGDCVTQTSGNMIFIDDVALVKTGNVTIPAALKLASGSTLRLDNPYKLVFENATVDGVPVSGGRGNLVAAGVTVEGSGAIRIGPPTGTVMVFR